MIPSFHWLYPVVYGAGIFFFWIYIEIRSGRTAWYKCNSNLANVFMFALWPISIPVLIISAIVRAGIKRHRMTGELSKQMTLIYDEVNHHCRELRELAKETNGRVILMQEMLEKKK